MNSCLIVYGDFCKILATQGSAEEFFDDVNFIDQTIYIEFFKKSFLLKRKAGENIKPVCVGKKTSPYSPRQILQIHAGRLDFYGGYLPIYSATMAIYRGLLWKYTGHLALGIAALSLRCN